MGLILKEYGEFVIIKHEHRDKPLHWDLMFELPSGSLATFRSGADAQQLAKKGGRLEKIFDHDKRFLSYEGAVNKGLGWVRICDKGVYRVAGECGDGLRLVIAGKFFDGTYEILSENNLWLIKKHDIVS